MKIRCKYDEMVAIEDLKPHPKNRNEHPEHQIQRLAEILEYQGWRYPVKVSKQSGFVTSGHGRIEAAKINGWHEVPVNFQDYDDEDQEYFDVQADNAIASWAELNLSKINTDLADLDPNSNIKMLGLQDFYLEPAEKFLDRELQEEDFDGPEKRIRIVITLKHKKRIEEALKILKIKKFKTSSDGFLVTAAWPQKEN